MRDMLKGHDTVAKIVLAAIKEIGKEQDSGWTEKRKQPCEWGK